MRPQLPLLSAFAVLAVPSFVAAQPAVEQHTERVTEAADENPDLTRITLSAGGVLATGNTRSVAFNGSGALLLQRDANVISAEVRGTYGEASLRDPMTGEFGEWTNNAESVQGRVRYDRFFTASDAAFASLSARRDRFAGLDSRLQFQIGYLREIFDEEGKHRLWGEIGYDLTYDNFEPDPLIDPMTMMELDGEAIVHSARAFAGYTHHLNEAVTFDTGVELLVNVEDPADTRVNWLSKFRSTIARGLQLSLDFELRWDNRPVPGKDELDTVTTLNLVLTIESPRPES